MLWIHPFWAFLLPIAASLPIGWSMFRTLDVPTDRAGRGLDALPMFLCRLIGRREPARMDWKKYAVAFIVFNLALFILTFGLLYAQPRMPLNPDGKGSLGALGYKDTAGVDHPGADTAVVFNTVCSFVTNTNLQHYAGEQNLSYFSQLACIVWLMFVTPAAGLAVMLATLRGLRGDSHLGDFYADLMRSLVYVFMPYCFLVAILLVGSGVPMTFQPAAQATTLDGLATKMETQTIARGPVAALVAIKQSGTNGGGFFGPNSTHPFENPTPWSNMLGVVSIIVLPMASLIMAGLMLKNMRHAVVIFSVMLLLLFSGLVVAVWAESYPSAATQGLPVVRGPNMEGKEVRLGPVAAATWAAITTATSNGSVNSMHDSLNPIAGMVPMALMMLNVVFSGIGAGFENMLMYVIVAVFLAGLMVGRTPEYLGKKVEAKEVKLAMIAILFHPLLICAGAGLFAATDWGAKTVANPGSHGFSEILYEFDSAAANNGSGFEGLGDNNPPWNIATGVVLLLGRFPALILPLALAGSLAVKKRVPETIGTLRVDNLTFAGMLLGTVLLVGALSFMPAVVLGPVADQLAAVPK
ncbi:potassium-transporting ATPase subunit KdpA [Singulisphaera acidiphila]|uniref:Potassium-transporting ATPase potassium-binding subunit n=1 Tax=Singulisphaera acidiphila (strain ATCC BAA-1392 / DSM 18658 / VKM B-2454 / MOB10) TaxID=886293 RepID=L0DLW9_SINAD|nr:potassium-transporting ATPase subunit KdpA [Singulisphaera acidiphila]AGA29676.1 K+-transporting ATPase, KdpA [Singulisphaera acidiphila DSM 18658]